jgi:hypothetical protein
MATPNADEVYSRVLHELMKLSLPFDKVIPALQFCVEKGHSGAQYLLGFFLYYGTVCPFCC